jgi:hypothetical protein
MRYAASIVPVLPIPASQCTATGLLCDRFLSTKPVKSVNCSKVGGAPSGTGNVQQTHDCSDASGIQHWEIIIIIEQAATKVHSPLGMDERHGHSSQHARNDPPQEASFSDAHTFPKNNSTFSFVTVYVPVLKLIGIGMTPAFLSSDVNRTFEWFASNSAFTPM